MNKETPDYYNQIIAFIELQIDRNMDNLKLEMPHTDDNRVVILPLEIKPTESVVLSINDKSKKYEHIPTLGIVVTHSLIPQGSLVYVDPITKPDIVMWFKTMLFSYYRSSVYAYYTDKSALDHLILLKDKINWAEFTKQSSKIE